jgi:hypothetical protein
VVGGAGKCGDVLGGEVKKSLQNGKELGEMFLEGKLRSCRRGSNGGDVLGGEVKMSL